MKKFIITDEQAGNILNVLADFPAKHTLGAIDTLRSGLSFYDEEAAEKLRKDFEELKQKSEMLQAQLDKFTEISPDQSNLKEEVK